MKQTAVEWLVDELNKSTSLTSFVPECNDDYKKEILGIIKQAKAMEKEQIIEAHKSGQHYADNFEVPHNEEAEDYYNSTFKSK